ncbi:MAG: hypothetical protein MZV65_29110 [Chromatiales bacterium]|nr:hypothetical protein [Chromatiales bacterium]
MIFLAAQKKAEHRRPGRGATSSEMGTIGKVLQLLRLPDGTVKVLVEGKSRARVVRFLPEERVLPGRARAPVPSASSPTAEPTALEALLRVVDDLRGVRAGSTSSISDGAGLDHRRHRRPRPAGRHRRRALLASSSRTSSGCSRPSTWPSACSCCSSLIKMEIEIFRMEQRIKSRVKEQMEKTQKEYYLNEQMRAIQKELGERGRPQRRDPRSSRRSSRARRCPRRPREKVEHELKKLKMMTPMSRRGDGGAQLHRLDPVACPGTRRPRTSSTIAEAEQILDEDHYGLEKVKERILEYLAVQALVKKIRGPILCFVGPPGVGKTSLGQVHRPRHRPQVRAPVARRRARRGRDPRPPPHLHRRAARQDHPVAQEGRRRTTRSSCLDEVDKMSMDFRGDPSAALLEVLDPEQNFAFNDHYLDLDYDLSDVMFITHGQHAARHPAAAAGPHGDHPPAGLHRGREATTSPSSSWCPSSSRPTGWRAERSTFSANAVPARSSGATRARPGCATSSARSPRVCRKVAAASRTVARRKRR